MKTRKLLDQNKTKITSPQDEEFTKRAKEGIGKYLKLPKRTMPELNKPRRDDIKGHEGSPSAHPKSKYKEFGEAIQELKQQQGLDLNDEVEYVEDCDVPTNQDKEFKTEPPDDNQHAEERKVPTKPDKDFKTNPPDDNQCSEEREASINPDEDSKTDPPYDDQIESRVAMEKLERRRKAGDVQYQSVNIKSLSTLGIYKDQLRTQIFKKKGTN